MIALGAGYAETCKSGSGGGSAETAAETQYGAAVPTSHILQCNESMIITDTKGALRQQVGGALAQNGYKVTELNLADCWASTADYNPLRCIRFDSGKKHYNEQDILRVAACLVPEEIHNDPFWDRAARMLLETLIGYLLERKPLEEHALDAIVRLLSEMHGGKPETRDGKAELYGGNTGKLLDECAQAAPDSFAAVRWRLYKAMTVADKTHACVLGVLAEKLSALTFDGASNLFHMAEQIDFASLGRKKTALFLTVSDTDRSLDPLAALFYAQALQELCAEADRKPEHRLAVPVRFYLDDFAANVAIPDFDKTVSVIRSREISVSIILQSLSQLESLYGHAKALTILNGCDNLLYLGGQDVETAKHVSIKANKPVSSVLNMPLDGAWLFTRGREPQQVRKYDVERHPLYGGYAHEPAEARFCREGAGFDFGDEDDEALPF